LKKYVFEPPPPPQEVEIQRRGRPRLRSGGRSAKETTPLSWRTRPTRMTTRRRYRTASSCGRGSAVLAYLTSPLVQDPPTSLEASLVAPPRKPHNASRKRVSKKLRVTETTSPEVSHLE
jgi:hypothetical protein